MIRFRLSPLLLALVAAPLSLALAACGSKTDDATATATSEPIAKIAAPSGQSWADVISKTPEGGYRMGNPDAPIKLIEFGALSCSHCAEFAKESYQKLREDYVGSGRVSYELRFFMLNAYDIPAALLATCGAPETVIPLSEQFWAWQSNMFQNIQAAGEAKLQAISQMSLDKRLPAIADTSGMTAFFAERGIAKAQAQACLTDAKKAQALTDQTEKAGKDFNVEGTPTFAINGVTQGSMGWAELETKLQAAGAR